MVIWYISKYASPQKYFFGTRHFYLAEEWVKMGNEAYIFTSNSSHLTDKLPQFKDKFFFEVINGIKTYWINTFSINSGSSSSIKRVLSWFDFERKLLLLDKKNISKPDVVIISSLSLLSVISGLYFSRKYKAKFIFEVRDIWPLSLMKLGNISKSHPFVLFLSIIEKLGYRKADAIVGTMPNLKEHVEQIIGKTDKCFTIPQGYSEDFYANQEKVNEIFIQQYIPKNKFTVAYTGTLNVNNPIDVLLDSAVKLKDEEVYFLIVGEGNRKNELVEKYKEFKKIKFAPYIPKNQINDLLRNYVDVAFDSFESDLAKFGLSRNKWIDYMLAGKPIICSYSGFQSMINEADCGSFVKYNDVNLLSEKILEYYKMPKTELLEMGESAKKYVLQNRSFRKLAQDYLDLINSLKSVI